MGVIQNSINQALGSVAGAALGVKHAKETEFTAANSAENNAIVARNKAMEAEDEFTAAWNTANKPGGLVEQLSVADAEKQEAEKALDKAVSRKNGSPITILEKLTSAQAANRAFKNLKDEYDSIMGMRERAIEQRAYANKLTERAIDKQAKYQSHWGGTN